MKDRHSFSILFILFFSFPSYLRGENSSTPDLFIYVHGTSTLLSSLERKIAHSAYPELFSAGTENCLLDLRSHFESLTDLFLTPVRSFQGEAYYYQWSGRLGTRHWNSGGLHLLRLLKERYGESLGEKKRLVLVSHSHGGQIHKSLLNLMELKATTQVHLITVNMPLIRRRGFSGSIDCDQLITWLNFQTKGDSVQEMGSWLMSLKAKRAAPTKEVNFKSKSRNHKNLMIPLKGTDRHNVFREQKSEKNARNYIKKEIGEVFKKGFKI